MSLSDVVRHGSPQAAQPLLITGGRIIDPSQGWDGIGDLLLVEGRVAWCSLGGAGTSPVSREECQVLPAGGLVVCPGFIDLHCHLREPGYEHKETIATGTLAAARGGFTTVCAMPNTDPPTDSAAVVEFVRRTAQEEGAIRVLPIGCITKGRRGEELAEMGELAQAGAVGFSDDGSPVANARLMRHALEYSRAFGLPVIEHCEEPTLAQGGVVNEGWVATRLGLRGVPAAAEEIAVARNIALAELTGGRLHLAHLSTAGSVELVRRAKERGLPVTAEVSPHHLTLTEERVLGLGRGIAWPAIGSTRLTTSRPPRGEPVPYDTSAKVNPPLRRLEDVRALVEGLRDGSIDAIATDHAPHAQEDKLCEFDLAAFGISGLETALGALLALVHAGDIDITLLIEKLTWGPAQILGAADGSARPEPVLSLAEGPVEGWRSKTRRSPSVPPLLGTLKVGAPADVALLDPEAEWTVEPEAFASKGRNTPLAGCTLRGKVVATFVGGKVVFAEKNFEAFGSQGGQGR